MADNAQTTELRTVASNIDKHLSQLEDYRLFFDKLTISATQAETMVSIKGYFTSIRDQLSVKRKQILNEIDALGAKK